MLASKVEMRRKTFSRVLIKDFSVKFSRDLIFHHCKSFTHDSST